MTEEEAAILKSLDSYAIESSDVAAVGGDDVCRAAATLIRSLRIRVDLWEAQAKRDMEERRQPRSGDHLRSRHARRDAGGAHGPDGGDGRRVIGCYECFDSANAAAIERVRETRCDMKLTASVITTTDKRVVVYSGNEFQITADSGPLDLKERRQLGWDVP
jgi:hypothetical protein